MSFMGVINAIVDKAKKEHEISHSIHFQGIFHSNFCVTEENSSKDSINKKYCTVIFYLFPGRTENITNLPKFFLESK